MVLVSHKHQLIFLKTRKTAGTSVEMLLEAVTGLGPDLASESRHAEVSDVGLVGFRMLPRDAMTDLDRTWQPHTPARKLRKHLGADIWDRYLKVACVRNPFDRVISHFHWSRDFAPEGEREETQEAFAQFVRSDWNDDRKVVMIGEAFAPDMVIRYEHLSEDLTRLSDRTGLTLNPSALPKTKVRRHRRLGEIADYFTEDLIQIVRTRLAWMFNAGGYAKSPTKPSSTIREATG